MREDRGITLIALIITIIVLLILAGISIATLTGANGVLTKANNAKKETELAAEKERLELIKVEVAMNHEGKVTIQDYLNELLERGITDETEITDGSENDKDFITDNGYSVNITPKGDDDIVITVEGKVGELKPILKKINLTPGKDNIKIEIEVRRAEGAQYKYYYKTDTSDYKLVTKPEGTEETICIIEGLEPNNYTIKVEATNVNGTVSKEEVTTIEQPTVEDLTEGEMINYTDKNGNTIKCAVLWDANSDYGKNGIHIVAMDTVETVGIGDCEGTDAGWAVTINAYNSAIDTFNERANQYLNTDYADSARCIGSKLDAPTYENEETWNLDGRIIKKEDTNYLADYNQLEKLKLTSIGKVYWLASRFGDGYTMGIRHVRSSGVLIDLLNCASGNFQGDAWFLANSISTRNSLMGTIVSGVSGHFYGLRPVFVLHQGITIRETENGYDLVK